MTDINNTVRKSITLLRKRNNLTQEEFGKIFSISGKTVSAWENGTRQISAKALADIIQYYKINLSDFISESPGIHKIHICHVCGNIITSTKSSGLICCGRPLKSENIDCMEDIGCFFEISNGILYVKAHHEMLYNHYITSISYITENTCTSITFSPSDIPEAKFTYYGKGTLYITCLKHGIKTHEIK